MAQASLGEYHTGLEADTLASSDHDHQIRPLCAHTTVIYPESTTPIVASYLVSTALEVAASFLAYLIHQPMVARAKALFASSPLDLQAT